MATLPAAAGVLVPPGHTLGEDYVYLGQSSQDMNEFAFTALSRRLKVIGVGLPGRRGLTRRGRSARVWTTALEHAQDVR